MKSAAVIAKDPTLTQLLGRLLAFLGSASSATFYASCDAALPQIAGKRPDVLLFDWSSVDEARAACEFFQKLRRTNGCRNVPILVFAKDLSARLVAIGTDYSIAKILLERTLSETLQPTVESLLADLAKPSSMRSHLVRLELAVEKEAFGEVDRIVEDFFALYPEHPRALVEYANLCIRRGNWAKARQTVTTAAQKFPDNLRVLNLAARLDMHEGRMQDAIASLEKADLLSPKNLDRMVMFGDAYRQTGDNDLARGYYDQALEIDGQNADARKGLGQVELSEGDVNAALEMFRDAASEEEVGGYFNNTAIVAVRRQDFALAMKLYGAARNAVRADVLRAKISYNQGLAYRKWNKLDEAIQAFGEALSFDAAFEKAKNALASFSEAKVREVLGRDVDVGRAIVQAEIAGIAADAGQMILKDEDSALAHFSTAGGGPGEETFLGPVSAPSVPSAPAAPAAPSAITVRDTEKKTTAFTFGSTGTEGAGNKAGTGAGKVDPAVAAPQKGSGAAPRSAVRKPEEKSPERDPHAPPAALDVPPAPKFMLDEEDF